MRIKFLLIALLTSVIGFSQSVNDYKAVIVPLKYEFLKTENQYRLSTMTKANLVKAGFKAFYGNEQLPAEFADRCDLLYADVKRDNGFLVTKLFVEFRDCYGKVVFTSQVGKSKEKEYESAYRESLEMAFVSINALQYKYNGKSANTVKTSTASVPATVQTVTTAATVSAPVADITDPNLLYAQPTENGYQLIDKTPKVVMKLLKTSRPDSFIAIKDGIQGSLNAKDNQWFFEYYKNDQLVSEKVVVKF
ncbi:hypothetical protein [Flavobacterium sp. KBS0721]|uniref:hypothetical protein n=1 Tax=Flavobacterium sp. KBS0721 TaxID=1179672 RepID=UPI00098F56FB|nr:hypothetical protein [Flavobacterium sp. KBS0721]QDW18945.1 hypothetical protein B0M43_0002110 [Flavobacterium sp. KBS0721]